MASSWRRRGVWALVMVALVLVVYVTTFRVGSITREVSYSELVAMIQRGELTEVEIGTDRVRGTANGSQDRHRVWATRPPGVDGARLVQLLDEHGVAYRGRPEASSVWTAVVS